MPRLVKLVPLGDPSAFKELWFKHLSITVRELLQRGPAMSLEPLSDTVLDLKVGDCSLDCKQVDGETPLFKPPGMFVGTNGQNATPPQAHTDGDGGPPADKKAVPGGTEAPVTKTEPGFPASIKTKDAVGLAYAREIDAAASFLRAELSVLVTCEKLVVEHLWRAITSRARMAATLLEVPEADEGGGLMARGLRQRQLARLKVLMRSLKVGEVLVIPHLDLLAGGSDKNLSPEALELTELAYAQSDRILLAFTDRSMDVPEVLAARFAVRLLISGVNRTVVYPDGTEKPIGEALITRDEAVHFDGYDPPDLHKNVAGMNPIRLRDAIRYAVSEVKDQGRVPVSHLIQAIRAFKAKTSANFEVPVVTFDDIGGYNDVKAQMLKALELMAGSFNLPREKLQRELIPRGFIFHGPPGTGKTLFAKAIANYLNATIQVVSGPEVTDMYVGESERKVRELFAEARRNAPAVLVFDEFDSIATKRSGREDGGSRAGNALVAQILTEMDGFRPDVPMLVIGTTNRLDIIDEALLRPSRFQPIAIDLPDLVARRAIAKVHAEHFAVGVPDELLDVIAAGTEGFNGDEIRSLFRETCVQLYCTESGEKPDATFFGKLVGRLRQGHEQRQAAASGHRTSALQDRRPGARVRPSGPMIELTPERGTTPAPNPEQPQTTPRTREEPRS